MHRLQKFGIVSTAMLLFNKNREGKKRSFAQIIVEINGGMNIWIKWIAEQTMSALAIIAVLSLLAMAGENGNIATVLATWKTDLEVEINENS